MARLPRLEIPGRPHLLIQRGHDRLGVFVDDVDRQAFRDALRQSARDSHVALHAYALASRQIWLLATPAAAGGLGQMMQRLGRRYVMGFNARHGRQGTLWEGRFRATVIEPERYLLTSMRLVESAPVDEQLVTHAHEWNWSSAAHHVGRSIDPLVSDHPGFWDLGNTPFEREVRYRQFLESAVDPAERQAMVDAALHGWVLGGEDHIALLAKETRRRLQPRPRGRPRNPRHGAAAPSDFSDPIKMGE